MNISQDLRPKALELPASEQDTPTACGYSLKIAAIHDDCLPWQWTTEVYLRPLPLVGPDCVQIARWTVEALKQLGDRLNATEAAIKADILILTISAARELPLNLHWWIDSWLPYRPQRPGLLMAILGVPPQPSRLPARIREYLHDVARLGHLDFLPHERTLPLGYPDIAAERAPESTQEIQHALGQVHRRHHSRNPRP